MMKQVLSLIPARYGSKRFAGKPLALILGKSLIRRTYESAFGAASQTFVVTDDAAIQNHVLSFGGNVLMSPDTCATGTERIAWALKQPGSPSGEIVVNVQGDEPLVTHEAIRKVVEALVCTPGASISTAVTEVPASEAASAHIVKCVRDKSGKALYFSRAPIPHGGIMNYKHLGLYAFRREFLLNLASLEKTPLQEAEDLEQLGWLERGFSIQTCVVKSYGPAVDTPQDIQTVENYLCQKNLSLSQAESVPH